MLLATTEMGLWVDLLREGQERARVALSETEESYTAFMLQRFTERQELTSITLALAYLESQIENSTAKRQGVLWDTADAGLILAGLFPERARTKNVPVSYFTGMSQVCYFELAQLCERMKLPGEAEQYREIGFGVERLAYVLYCTRRKNTTVGELLGVSVHTFH